MNKYLALINILDKIRKEALDTPLTRYNPDNTDIELINQARSRAFIHLYLKVSFGLLDFREREHFVTDGTYDGGIDGYFIDKEKKVVFFIQSKFRTSVTNFEKKKIELEEILAMDIDRILSGEEKDDQGNVYNGKIKQIMREISQLEGIGSYKYKVILIANLLKVSDEKLRRLTGGYDVQIFDYEKCYQKLVFPVISGTYFNASDVNIYIDLSNKNAGSQISYEVQTKRGKCEITALFIPTIEIAKIMHKYKNSILKYNPRSYLEHEGQRVNSAIRETILSETTNEFAIFNNGITMLSDETDINLRIGLRNKAQLTVKNPQIINGGQTAFTLSKIYEENLNNNVESIFENKEVLIKVITFLDDNNLLTDDSELKKLTLIDEISNATNQQTVVVNADKFANDPFQKKLQQILFDRYGILYERKRGEFADGISNKYISDEQILERNLFLRIYYAIKGELDKSVNRKVFVKHKLEEENINIENLDEFYFGFLCFQKLNPVKSSRKRDKSLFAQLYFMTKKYKPENILDFKEIINRDMPLYLKEWEGFINYLAKTTNKKHLAAQYDKEQNKLVYVLSPGKLFNSEDFLKDISDYFDTTLN